jgi:hypothetical protein
MPKSPTDEPTLITIGEAAELLGADRLNECLAIGRLRAFPFNSRPGAPSMLVRASVERIARRLAQDRA